MLQSRNPFNPKLSSWLQKSCSCFFSSLLLAPFFLLISPLWYTLSSVYPLTLLFSAVSTFTFFPLSMPYTNSRLLKPPSQYLLLPLTHLWQSIDLNSKYCSLSPLPKWFLHFMAPSTALSLRSANLKCCFINLILLLSLIQLSSTPFPVSFSIYWLYQLLYDRYWGRG